LSRPAAKEKLEQVLKDLKITCASVDKFVAEELKVGGQAFTHLTAQRRAF